MSELRAETLSPIDAATLFPQHRRLVTEVVATRGENLMLTAGLAATGLTRLPRMPRTAVLAVKRGLGYRGVLVTRELAGGAGWQVESLRLAREADDEALHALVAAASMEVARRQGRRLYLRSNPDSPHVDGLRRAGFAPYSQDQLFALKAEGARRPERWRPAGRVDRHAVFRLYTRVVPEVVRRFEAPSLADWRSVSDSYGCDREWVLDGDGGLAGWVALGENEAHALCVEQDDRSATEILSLVASEGRRGTTFVLREFQTWLAPALAEHGASGLGERLLCARLLARMQPLKEAVTAVEPLRPAATR